MSVVIVLQHLFVVTAMYRFHSPDSQGCLGPERRHANDDV